MGIGVRRPAGRPASLAFDAAIVVALTALYQWQVWTMGTVAGPRWLTTLVVPLLIDLPLLWRRTVPLLVLTLVFVGIDLQAVVTGNAAESLGTFGSALVAAYSVTRYGDRRRGLLAIPIVLVGAVVHDLEDPEVRTSSQIQGRSCSGSSWWRRG
ncbi:MAG TPA: hypothetical protein VLB81_16550 [Gaiellales bacterium]|nr:hypothetical protein [Gaiellales bacterium]